VRGNEIDCFDAEVHLNPNHPAPFRLPPVFEFAMINRPYRKAGQDCHTVLPTLIVKIMGEGVIHGCQLCEFSDFIFAFRPFHSSIDLLQPDQVRMLAINYISDALQIELLVHANADVNVVSHHTKNLLRSRDGCGCSRPRSEDDGG
jgi:hypothetical protein